MPMMVHLTPARNVRQILRTGIRKDRRGVYCMPVLQDYYTSHQWLRELRRWGPGPFVAIYFRLDDAEIVRYGPFWQTHKAASAARAVHIFRQQSDTQGWEILLSRSIAAREIHKVQALSQVIGWRYRPYGHDRPWCHCPVCVSRGEFNASKMRERRQPSLTYDEIISSLRHLHARLETCLDRTQQDCEIASLLYSLYYRKAGAASDFLFLLDYPSDEVLEALADLLGVYRNQKEARKLLQEVNARRATYEAARTHAE